MSGHPAVFLDIEKRQFFLFGRRSTRRTSGSCSSCLSGVGFGLVYATAVLGRVWCGWACPQTVFLEAMFRPIERLIDGPRERRAPPRARGPVGLRPRLARPLRSTRAYLVAALLVAHVFIAYFVSIPRVFAMVRTSPGAHPEAFAWMLAATGIFYGNFAWFREQLCVVVCPYGRLQSVLLDDDSLVVGYDEKRGEPRGKAQARSRAKRAAATASTATAASSSARRASTSATASSSTASPAPRASTPATR